MPEARRMTVHTAKFVWSRGRRHLDHGHPRCDAVPLPGSTSIIDELVTCETCRSLLEQDRAEGKK